MVNNKEQKVTPMTQDCSYNELYPLQVLDDSMEPEFPNGCVIVLEPSRVCASGAYVVIKAHNDRWFRRFVKDADGNARLVAENGDYPALPLTAGEYEIEGVVVQRNIKRAVKHYQPCAPYNAIALQ